MGSRLHSEAIIELNLRALGSEPGFWELGFGFCAWLRVSEALDHLVNEHGSEPLPQAWVIWGPKYVLECTIASDVLGMDNDGSAIHISLANREPRPEN